jgi:hypothetical protein
LTSNDLWPRLRSPFVAWVSFFLLIGVLTFEIRIFFCFLSKILLVVGPWRIWVCLDAFFFGLWLSNLAFVYEIVDVYTAGHVPVVTLTRRVRLIAFGQLDRVEGIAFSDICIFRRNFGVLGQRPPGVCASQAGRVFLSERGVRVLYCLLRFPIPVNPKKYYCVAILGFLLSFGVCLVSEEINFS